MGMRETGCYRPLRVITAEEAGQAVMELRDKVRSARLGCGLWQMCGWDFNFCPKSLQVNAGDPLLVLIIEIAQSPHLV